jgi:hypothetical protein
VKEKKLLLCIPRGGLNDTLCQIEKCRQYAKQFDRMLYLDSRRSGLLDEFSIYFKVLDTSGVTVVTPSTTFDYGMLNKLSVMPSVVAGKIDTYSFTFSKERRNWCEELSGDLLTFDMTIDHDGDLLLHEQGGGGSLSHSLIPHLRFSDELKATIELRLASLPEKYVAIHVRNTDYKSEYHSFFESIKDRVVDQTLLVCSDDATVIAEAKGYFSRSSVINITNTNVTNQKPLHRPTSYENSEQRIDATFNAITDLVALASAEKLFFPQVEKTSLSGVKSLSSSGFSRLAQHLHRNKVLIRGLMHLN